MKIIFLGTPHFAENVLQKLIDSKHEVVAVVCQPDKLVGRKQVLEAPPTKVLAEKYNIPVYQFNKIRLDGAETLKKLDADIMITAAYGQILSQEILDITPKGVVNVHGSVLPKYRGSAPIQWSLINGEKTLGVTILQTHIGMDDGPIIHTKEFDIQRDDTVESLYEKISQMGAELLLEALEEIEDGTVVFMEQDEAKATKCKMLKKEEAVIDFDRPALEIENMIRGMEVWPVAYTFLNNATLKIYKARECDIEALKQFDDVYSLYKTASAGEVICCDKKGIIVKCKDSCLSLNQLQLEGGKKLFYKDFVNGNKIKLGDKLGK